MPHTPIEIYVACPYTSPSADTRFKRYMSATKYAASLMSHHKIVFSPLTHGFPCEQFGVPDNCLFWQRSCLAFLSASAHLHVLTLPRWQHSIGLAAELAFFKPLDRPITYVHRSKCFYTSP